MRSTLGFLLVLGSVAAACGGAADTPLLGDGGGGGGDGSTVDSVAPDGGANCDVSRCANVPAGFHAVSLVDATASCPNGFDTSDLVTAPIANDGACTCACNVTTQPDCTNGSVTRYLQTNTSTTCSQQATTFQANGGACTQIQNGALYLSYSHYAVNAPPPSGGACQYDATVDPQKVSSTKARVCAPPASCQGAVCDGASVCVAQTGDVACPGDFPKKTLVGTSATADCSACGGSCSVTGDCTGTFSVYTDPSCTQNGVDFTADGTCSPNPATTTTAYTYYQYAGSVKTATCGGTAPTSTATATLDGTTTVCCKN